MPENSLESAQRSTEGMVDYDRHSSAQQTIVQRQDALIRGLVERIGRVDGEFRVVDYGCGPGTSAITAVQPAIEASRRLHPEREVAVCHADQPGNDWNSLFSLVWGPSGYQTDLEGVRTEAAIGSFYDRMVPEATVDLATCFVASHWLDGAVPLYSPGSVWFADLTGEARQEMYRRAQRDWTRFLRRRAAELREGGVLLVATLGSIPDESEINETAASGRGIYRALQAVAQDMADDGLIDTEVLDRFVFSLWFLTAEEAHQPLIDDDHLSRVFAVESISVEPTPQNPHDFFAPLIADPAAYADAYTGYIRAFADSTLRNQVIAPSASEPAAEDDLASEFYERLSALYQTHLDAYAFELWHLTVVLSKR